MDPNATLRQLRDIAWHWNVGDADASDLETAIELFEALDGWLSKGGFPPGDWINKNWE